MGNLVRNAEGVGGGASAPAAPAPSPGTLAGASALAGSPAPVTPVVTTPNNPSAATAPAAGDGEAPWYSGLPSTFQTALQAKGWNGLSKDEALTTVLDSYVNLEKLIGADKAGRTVTIPKEDATPEERADFFKKIGTPEKPEDYGFSAIKDIPDSVRSSLEDAQKWMHKAGVPKMVGENLMREVAAAEVAKAAEWSAHSQAEMNALAVELGADFDNKKEMAQRAFRAAGLDADAALKIEQAIGTKAMMKLFMGYGDNIREAEPPAPGNAGGQFQQTTEGAKSEIANLFQDKDFMANYLSPNPRVRETAIAKMERLQKIAAGG